MLRWYRLLKIILIVNSLSASQDTAQVHQHYCIILRSFLFTTENISFLLYLILSLYYSACIPWCNWCTFGCEEVAQATWGGTREIYFKHVNDITIIDAPLLHIHVLYNIPGEERTWNWGGCEDCYSQLWWTGTFYGLKTCSEKSILYFVLLFELWTL